MDQNHSAEMEQLRAEIRNAKDPIEVLVIYFAAHARQDKIWQEEMSKEFANLNEKIDPITNAFQATSYIRSAGGWIIAIIAGAIITYNYVVEQISKTLRG